MFTARIGVFYQNFEKQKYVQAASISQSVKILFGHQNNCPPMSKQLIRPEYETLIFEFRGQKVMVDADLAALYEVATKALKQQVRRNASRFPPDFMFELNSSEKAGLVTNCDRLASLKHSSVPILCFTEQGVAMLSSVLRSEKAIEINIEIMRAFARYRAILNENADLRREMKALEAKLNQAFKFLLDKIDALQIKPPTPRTPIGFKKDPPKTI